MRRFDHFTVVWGICILVLGYAMSAQAWLVGPGFRAGLFTFDVDGRTMGWPSGVPASLAAARYLALIGTATAIATTTVAAMFGNPRRRPWIAVALLLCALAVASFRVFLKLAVSDRVSTSWWLALGAIVVAMVAVALDVRKSAPAPGGRERPTE